MCWGVRSLGREVNGACEGFLFTARPYSHWRIQGRDRVPPPPRLFQDETEARRAEKKLKFFWDPSPFIWRSESATDAHPTFLLCLLRKLPKMKPKGLYCIFIYLYIILSIVVIFSLSSTSFLNLNSNFWSRFSVFFHCSSGPEEGKFLLAKILAPNKSALCRIDSLVFSFVIFLYIYITVSPFTHFLSMIFLGQLFHNW